MRVSHIGICRSVLLDYISPHYFINGTFFENKLLNTKCVFWFSLQFLSETFLILRRSQIDITQKLTQVFMQSAPYTCHALAQLEVSWQMFGKSSYIKSNGNPPSGSRLVVPCKQTGRTKSKVAFRNFVTASKNQLVLIVTTSLKWLTLYSSTRFPAFSNLCVLCGSQNKQRLFSYTALTDWFL